MTSIKLDIKSLSETLISKIKSAEDRLVSDDVSVSYYKLMLESFILMLLHTSGEF